MPGWESSFPNLGNTWACHSPRTPPRGQITPYNCHAFAAGDTDRRWEPDPSGQEYWPPGATRNYSLAAFVEAYQTIGYTVCTDGLLEDGHEKISLYVGARGIVEHTARQLADGRWTSKLGYEEDIIHDTPESLSSATYGAPVCYMTRPRT